MVAQQRHNAQGGTQSMGRLFSNVVGMSLSRSPMNVTMIIIAFSKQEEPGILKLFPFKYGNLAKACEVREANNGGTKVCPP